MKGRIYRCLTKSGEQLILKVFAASDPNLEREYHMLRRLRKHPNVFVQLHTAVVVGSARLGLEMEYIHDAVIPFSPVSDAELRSYMQSLFSVRDLLVLLAILMLTRPCVFYTMSSISSMAISSRTMCYGEDSLGV